MNVLFSITSNNTTIGCIINSKFTEGVIPHKWYQLITRKARKPYLLAIAVLAKTIWDYQLKALQSRVVYVHKPCSNLWQNSYNCHTKNLISLPSNQIRVGKL